MLYSYIGGTSPVLVLQLLFSQEEEISSIMFHLLVTLTVKEVTVVKMCGFFMLQNMQKHHGTCKFWIDIVLL